MDRFLPSMFERKGRSQRSCFLPAGICVLRRAPAGHRGAGNENAGPRPSGSCTARRGTASGGAAARSPPALQLSDALHRQLRQRTRLCSSLSREKGPAPVAGMSRPGCKAPGAAFPPFPGHGATPAPAQLLCRCPAPPVPLSRWRLRLLPVPTSLLGWLRRNEATRKGQGGRRRGGDRRRLPQPEPTRPVRSLHAWVPRAAESQPAGPLGRSPSSVIAV